MDLHYLRSATRPEHEATEAAMPLLGPGLTAESYGRILRCLLPVLSSWEAWSAEHAPERLRVLLEPRRRSGWLEADLRVLSGPPGTERSDAVQMFEGRHASLPWADIVLQPGETEAACTPGQFEAGFLGALYVLEGSTLGGRFLSKQVETALGLTPGRGNAYFEGHGAATGAMWREVTAEIAAVPDDLSERLIGSARRTFEAFGQALAGCQGFSGERVTRTE